MASRIRLLCVSLVVLAACAPDDAGQGPVEIEVVATRCTDLPCGNSPILGGTPIWELDQSWPAPSWSPTGFQIESFRSAGNVPLRLVVSGLSLFGIKPDHMPVSGAGLLDAKLVVKSKAGPRFQLTIEAVDALGGLDYVQGGAIFPLPAPIHTYRWVAIKLDVPPPAGGAPTPEFLCPGGLFGSDAYLAAKDAVIFAGDRYSQATGTVTAAGQDAAPWFNIACRDDALWKLVIFRYVQAASSESFPSDLISRTAVLRSIRADYCADNVAYTDLGEHVKWENSGGWLASSYTNVEAVWGPTGAVCLSTPRHVDRDAVACAATLNWCNQDDITNFVAHGNFMVTYLP